MAIFNSFLYVHQRVFHVWWWVTSLHGTPSIGPVDHWPSPGFLSDLVRRFEVRSRCHLSSELLERSPPVIAIFDRTMKTWWYISLIYIYIYIDMKLWSYKFWLVVWNMNFMTFHILGMSSSQLTFTPSFFRGVGLNHQPELDGHWW